jgi:hypothetical protein
LNTTDRVLTVTEAMTLYGGLARGHGGSLKYSR